MNGDSYLLTDGQPRSGGASHLVAVETGPEVRAISVLVCSDLLALTLTIGLAQWCFGAPTEIARVLILIGSLSFALGLGLFELYPGRGMMGPSRIRSRALLALIAFVSPALVGILLRSPELGSAAVQCFCIGILLFFFSSFFELVAIHIADSCGIWRSRAVFVGDGTLAARVKKDLELYPELGLELVERGSTDQVIAIEAVGLNSSMLGPDAFLVATGSPLPIYYPIGRKTAGKHQGGKENFARCLKRGLDIIGAVTGLILVSPLLIVCSTLIYYLDGRPIFFSQERGGFNGKTFRVWKLRSMYRDAHLRLNEVLTDDPLAREEWEKHFKLREDPRVLPKIGTFIRCSSIDELPQLWNVLKGDMSLVGPRPFPMNHLEIFPAEFRTLRSKAVPGLSGLWQVTLRSNGEICDQEHLDRAYVEEWSLWLDLYILFRTPIALLTFHGAR